MKRKNRNSAALCLITLFLLSAFARENFGQQSNPFFAQNFIKSIRAVSEDFDAGSGKIFDGKSGSESDNLPSTKKQTGNYTRPNAGERIKKYAKRTFGGSALLGTVAAAGFAQLIDSPEEWEDDSRGFARRVGSAFGKTVIEETTVYALDEALKLDSNFYRSGKKDFRSRLKSAVLSTFTARKPSGRRVAGIPRVAGALTGNIVAAEFWYPKNYDFKDGLRYGASSLGFDVLVNLFREFFPK